MPSKANPRSTEQPRGLRLEWHACTARGETKQVFQFDQKPRAVEAAQSHRGFCKRVIA